MALLLNQEFKVYSQAAYRSLFKEKSVLVVLDDVWTLEDLQPFRLDSGNSRVLYTTRIRELASAFDAENHDVNLLDSSQARLFLARWSGLTPESLPEPHATAILSECRGLVLGLAMIGAALKKKPASAWTRIVRNLKNARLRETGARVPDYAYDNLYASIWASFEELSFEEKQLYRKLAILLEDMPAPPSLVQQI
jgi:hypothetical protein